jgi:hypothetical protein
MEIAYAYFSSVGKKYIKINIMGYHYGLFVSYVGENAGHEIVFLYVCVLYAVWGRGRGNVKKAKTLLDKDEI